MGIARDRGLRTLLQPDHAPCRVGVEHEFRVLLGEEPVDFRSLIHDLHLGQPNLDPADPNAYRLPSGAAVTCDGAEAEIALAPTRVGPGFAEELTLRASHERAALASRLPPRHRLVGCSTHLSVSVPDELTQPVCRLYATIFAPAMMLLMDRRDSPGLLIRPRPGRVELGGEFVEGDELAAAALFAVGSVLACQTALSDGDLTRQRLPPELLVRVDAAVERFGWYVDRRAFGGDLYASGRSAMCDRRMAGSSRRRMSCAVAGAPLARPSPISPALRSCGWCRSRSMEIGHCHANPLSTRPSARSRPAMALSPPDGLCPQPGEPHFRSAAGRDSRWPL